MPSAGEVVDERPMSGHAQVLQRNHPSAFTRRPTPWPAIFLVLGAGAFRPAPFRAELAYRGLWCG